MSVRMGDDDDASSEAGGERPASGHVAWLVELVVQPGRVRELRGVTAEMVAVAQREPGTISYLRFFSADATMLHGFEVYENAAAAVLHLETFNDRFAGPFLALAHRQRCTVYGDTSIALRRLLHPLRPTYFAASTGFWA